MPTGLTHFAIKLLPETVTFRPDQWNGQIIVKVNVIPDDVDSPVELERLVLEHRATGGDYGVAQHYPQADFSVDVTGDDDTRGLSMAADRPEGEEGETFRFSVRLTSEPTDDVTLMLRAESGRFELLQDTFELDFTSGNWQVSQTVVVMVEDDDVDARHDDGVLDFFFTGAAGTSDYQSLPVGTASSVTVTVRDNDSRGFALVLAGLPLQLSEAGGVSSGFYTVALQSEPTADVEVRPSLSGLRFYQAGAAPTLVTFTPANWRTPQRIDITVLDNAVDASPDNEIETLLITHRVTGGDYEGRGPQLDSHLSPVTVTGDDDTRGLSIAAARTEGMEGETFIFNVRLTSEPTADVTFMLTAESDNFVVAQSAFQLDFTAGNWQDLQTVAVMVEDDALDSEDGVLTLAFTGAAGTSDYNLLRLPGGAASATVRDNDASPVLRLTLIPSAAVEGSTDGSARNTVLMRLRAEFDGAARSEDTVFRLSAGAPGDPADSGLDYAPPGEFARHADDCCGAEDSGDRLLSVPGSGPDRRGRFRGTEHRRQSDCCHGRAGRHRPGLGRLHDHRRRQRRHCGDGLDGASTHPGCRRRPHL